VKGGIAGGTVLGGGQAMATKLKMVVDPAVGVEKTLPMASGLEPLHLPLSSSRRLVRYFGPVVEVATLSMLDTRHNPHFSNGVGASGLRIGESSSATKP
jgi:hypothetical protein